MKIVFLDIDGVLNSELTKDKLNNQYYELLYKLVEATDCYFVITSSWRCMTLEDTKWELSGHIAETNKKNKNRASKLQDNPFPQWLIDRIVGITPRMYTFVGNTTRIHFLAPRGVEIEHYVITNNIKGKYVIIDDDNDFLIYQKDKLIITDSKIGLTEENINRCIEMLN